MAIATEEWAGLLKGRRTDSYSIKLIAVLQNESVERGGSRPFQGLASDKQIYWIKMLSNNQTPRVPVTEQVISRVAALIDAPVCEVSLINISEDFDEEKLGNGTTLKSGIAHASKHIEHNIFDKTYEPQHRNKDDNRARHARYFAMFDWCWGEDKQWLYDTHNDMSMYSHDHGLFLPGNSNWTSESLLAHVDEPHPLEASTNNLSPELMDVADNLDEVHRQQLVDVLATVPKSWPVTDEELELLGWFLESRAKPVATRLRKLASIFG